MPGLIFQLSEDLLTRAFRALLSNGPRRSGERLQAQPYAPVGEVVNGPCPPPLYTVDEQGIISLACPVTPTWAPRPAPLPASLGVAELPRDRPAPFTGNIAHPVSSGGKALHGSPMAVHVASPFAGRAGLGGSELVFSAPQIHPPQSSALPPGFTDVQIEAVFVARGDEAMGPGKDATISRLLGEGVAVASPRTFWSFGQPGPNDPSVSRQVFLREGDSAPDVFVTVSGTAKFFDPNTIDGSLPADSDSAPKKPMDAAFRRIAFDGSTGGMLVFRASVAPARYRHVAVPYPRRERQPDYKSSTTTPAASLGRDLLAIDLVLDPVLEIQPGGSYRNPIASDAWNLDPDNQALLSWLAEYSDRSVPDYKTADGRPAPDLPGFRYSYYLPAMIRPSGWPFNVGLTATRFAPRAAMIALDLAPADTDADFRDRWESFFSGPSAPWGWPPQDGSDADFGVTIDPGFIVAAANNTIAPALARSYSAVGGGVTFDFKNPQLTFDEQGLHIQLDVSLSILGVGISGTVNFTTSFHLDGPALSTETTYSVDIQALWQDFSLPNDWTDSFFRGIGPFGNRCTVDHGVIRCAASNSGRTEPLVGTFSAARLWQDQQGLHLYGDVTPPAPDGLPPFGHLAVTNVSGFQRPHGQKSTDLELLIELHNGGSQPTTLWDIVIRPSTLRISFQDGTLVYPPSWFWSIGWAPGTIISVGQSGGAYLLFGTEVVIPSGETITVRIGANFSAVAKGGGVHLNAAVAVLLTSSSHVTLITPRTQPFVANAMAMAQLPVEIEVPGIPQIAVPIGSPIGPAAQAPAFALALPGVDVVGESAGGGIQAHGGPSESIGPMGAETHMRAERAADMNIERYYQLLARLSRG